MMEYLNAFLCGGLLCAVGQIILDKTALTPGRILTGYVVTGVLLQAVGVYQYIADWGGAGATVPLTGFGYSLAKGVAKAVAEKGALGILTRRADGHRPAASPRRRCSPCWRQRCAGRRTSGNGKSPLTASCILRKRVVHWAA